MVSKLTKAMSELSQNDNDETHHPQQDQQQQNHQQQQQQKHQGRRKSARLNTRRGETEEQIHDSGTESDEEEMECIAKLHDPRAPWQNYDEFLSGASPPPLTASPPLLAGDGDTESWYSFGHESGIMTGDNDSDDGSATPTPNRRQLMRELGARNEDDTSSVGGEKRRYSMTTNDHPIAWRLRSFNLDAPRPVKIAARRCPVHVLINRPPTETMCQFRQVQQQEQIQQHLESDILPAPAPKRNRRNSHRPSLDFEKMVETRIQSPSPPPSAPTVQKPVTRSQINQ